METAYRPSEGKPGPSRPAERDLAPSLRYFRRRSHAFPGMNESQQQRPHMVPVYLIGVWALLHKVRRRARAACKRLPGPGRPPLPALSSLPPRTC